MNNILFIDFETYFDSKQKYDLKNVSICEYVRDPRFKIHGFAYCSGNGIPKWETDLEFFRDDFSDTAIAAHNIKFDGFILTEKFGIKPMMWIDTKGMSKAVLGKTVKGHSLRALAEHFGLESKGFLNSNGILNLSAEQEKELSEYCIHDVDLCRQIFNKLEPFFPYNQYGIMDWTIQAFVEPKLDLNVKLLEETTESEKKKKETVFNRIGIPKDVFSSNAKFAKLLQSSGYEIPTKTSIRTNKKIPALALGDIEFIEMKETENEELKKLIEARIAAKSTLLETRSANLAEIGKTGKWPFDIEFSGAQQTHRFSGGNGAGGNPQNFTRNSSLRESVCAPKGFKLLVGDFSNIELRLVAYLSKDPGLIQALENDVDLYCDFASAFYGRMITKEDKLERQFGKTAILGLGYGMGPMKFQKTVKLQTGQSITTEEAQKAVNLYRARYNQVPKMWDGLQKDIEKLKYSYKLPSGLLLQYPNLRQEGKDWVYDVWKKKTEKESVKLYGGKILENICQALAGELCKKAIENLLFLGYNVVGQVHDEILVLVKEEDVDVAIGIVEAAMTKSPDWLPRMVLKCDIKAGDNWGIK